jgi:ferric hydroxamate transport system permease protein
LLGDPRILPVLSWLSGSTYAVTETEAMAMVLIAILSLILLPFASRLLTILPLGAAIARELGLAQGRGRLALLLATALLTGAATLIAGPLSFVGLMAPHLARLLGFRTPVMQAYAAALTGAVLMVGADWIGRMIAFPWQVPAGFVATVIGALFYMTLLARK